MSIIFKMAVGSHFGFHLGMLDHPRSAIVVLSLVLKFGVDPIWDFYILAFWLEIAYSSPFWGVLGAYFPEMWLPIVLTHKRHFLARKHVV